MQAQRQESPGLPRTRGCCDSLHNRSVSPVSSLDDEVLWMLLTKVQSTFLQSDKFDRLYRLKDLNAKAPEELKAYCECMDYYRYMWLKHTAQCMMSVYTFFDCAFLQSQFWEMPEGAEGI